MLYLNPILQLNSINYKGPLQRKRNGRTFIDIEIHIEIK